MVINTYCIGINNLNDKLVIEKDIPLSFDSIIQQMGKDKTKNKTSVFILFTSK